MRSETIFPQGFLWGAATSAYQVEGSPLADGAGASIWHRFCRTPGRVAHGDTGDVACDHYRRFADDVAIMKRLGLGAYRFSISWSRILPDGAGRVNQAGLDFYRRLVDALLEAGITPMATLYHWDLPAALDDRGGWLNRNVADWFADYATVCYRALPGVEFWATLNEPWVITDSGYLHGVHAPGHRGVFGAARAAHNLMRSHAAGVLAHRSEGRGRIGVVVNIEPKHPASSSPADRAATTRADAYMNRQFLDPMLLGSYPEELSSIYGEGWDPRFDAEAGSLAVPIDWLGVNYYTRAVVRADASIWPVGDGRVEPARATSTKTGWEVYPQGLAETLLRINERYSPPPLYITENGSAFDDPPVATGGRVDDPLRVAYLRAHLGALRAVFDAGVDLRGYFAWSLLDNLEWSLGYSKRFGLVHVDFSTQARTPKASAHFYAEVVRTNGAVLGDPAD